jgi:hypothetical protein
LRVGFAHNRDFTVDDEGKVLTTVLVITLLFVGLSVLSAFIVVLQQTLAKVVRKADYVVVHTTDVYPTYGGGGGGGVRDGDESLEGTDSDDELVHISIERQSILELDTLWTNGKSLEKDRLSIDKGGWKFDSRSGNVDTASSRSSKKAAHPAVM